MIYKIITECGVSVILELYNHIERMRKHFAFLDDFWMSATGDEKKRYIRLANLALDGDEDAASVIDKELHSFHNGKPYFCILTILDKAYGLESYCE